ncbi:MAG: VOC family protein [Tepidisphaeraceae bacterium]|jgi:catechol 2,3-dioxygenase-like lactoylglutathione lyase family enzyme
MLRKIDRVILRVANVAAAAAYYRDVLQVPVLRLEAHVAAFALPDGGELILLDDSDQPFEQVYFLVDDVCDLYRRRGELRLTFTQPPRKVARGYRATVKDPFGTVLLILDRTADLAEAIEDAKPPEGLFAGTEPDATAKPLVLVKLYEELGRTADDLPYTPHFERLYAAYAAQHGTSKPTRRQAWRHLLNLRKSGKLPKLGQAPTPPPQVSEEAIALLRNLITQHAGPFLGKRDRLPYTEEFDALVNAFNAKQAKPLSPHLIWRLVARLAK